MDVALLVYVWGVLALVVAGYVAYRLISNRRRNADRHSMYPLASNPGDGFLPRREEKLLWVAYVAFATGMTCFLAALYFEVVEGTMRGDLATAAGLGMVIGGILTVAHRLTNKRSGPA